MRSTCQDCGVKFADPNDLWQHITPDRTMFLCRPCLDRRFLSERHVEPEPTAPDAAFLYDELRARFTREWEVRHDLHVVADACNRDVLIDGARHSVCTTREYVAVLEAACKFVEEANPKWASHSGPVAPPTKFEISGDDNA